MVGVIKEEKSAVVFSFEVKDKEYGEKTKKLGDIFDVHSVERGIAHTTQEEGMCFTCIQVLSEDELTAMLNDLNRPIRGEGPYLASTAESAILSYAMVSSVIGDNHLGYGNSYDNFIGRKVMAHTGSSSELLYNKVPDPELQKEVDVIIRVDLFAHMDITAA